MNLRQLRMLCEVVNSNFNASAAAAALHTSQPSVSRHLIALEQELGVKLLARSKRRLVGLTGPGEIVLQSARRVLFELENIQQAGARHHGETRGNLTVAASHTHARYSLPKIVSAFIARYPEVKLALRQGDPYQIVRWVASGEADIGICAEPPERPKGVIFLPCHQHDRIVLAPKQHPIARLGKKPTLTTLARYPLITYDAPFMVHRRIVETFDAHGIRPNFVLTATDVDVMKTYVRAGLGLAIVASRAYDAAEDKGIVAISVNHLFRPDLIKLALRKDTYHRSYAYDFIERFSPSLNRAKVQAALFDQRDAG